MLDRFACPVVLQLTQFIEKLDCFCGTGNPGRGACKTCLVRISAYQNPFVQTCIDSNKETRKLSKTVKTNLKVICASGEELIPNM